MCSLVLNCVKYQIDVRIEILIDQSVECWDMRELATSKKVVRIVVCLFVRYKFRIGVGTHESGIDPTAVHRVVREEIRRTIRIALEFREMLSQCLGAGALREYIVHPPLCEEELHSRPAQRIENLRSSISELIGELAPIRDEFE